MGWFNYYGLIAVAVIMVPNIISAIVDKSAFENRYNNAPIVICEQTGRYGCMAFMIGKDMACMVKTRLIQ